MLSTICLCRRAGMLVTGFDAVLQELSSRKSDAAGIVLAADVSPKTEKEIRFAADKRGTEVIRASFTMDEAQKAVGKRVGVFLILDAGLYGSVKKHTAQLQQLSVEDIDIAKQ